MAEVSVDFHFANIIVHPLQLNPEANNASLQPCVLEMTRGQGESRTASNCKFTGYSKW